jgi:hypothetical protein
MQTLCYIYNVINEILFESTIAARSIETYTSDLEGMESGHEYILPTGHSTRSLIEQVALNFEQVHIRRTDPIFLRLEILRLNGRLIRTPLICSSISPPIVARTSALHKVQIPGGR